MKSFATVIAITWAGLWWTDDQQGRRHFDRGQYQDSAEAFVDPMWQGVAWYRAKEFEKAAQAFARRDTPEALFNQGNAWVLLGKYEKAVSCYESALDGRPGWTAARENRDLAAARAKLLDTQGGDMGDQKLGADKVVFDKKQNEEGGQDTEVSSNQALSDAQIQALWLRRVATRPADFLRAKFAYQAAQTEEAPE